MKAFTVSTYGDPEEVVKLVEESNPSPTGDQVLLKVKTAPINDYDWSVVSGTPFSYRLLFGLSKPRKKFRRLGMEVAGVVEELGPECTKFGVGDAVYGDTSNHEFGSFSEYLCVSEQALTAKPVEMSFEDAAAIPHAAMLAYQGLIDLGNIKEGQQVLINGAGGGMGTFAVQIAKTFRAEVTGVDKAAKFESLKTLGYDHVIDFEKEDFTKNGKKYDLILDARTTRSPWAFPRSLVKGGRFITVGGRSRRLIQILLFNGLIKLFTGKTIKILGLRANKYLEQINELYKQGLIKPLIDGPYPFEETPKRIKYFGSANHKGKVVITVDG